MQIKVAVNGKEHIWEVAGDDFLADVLRQHGFLSIRQGCDTSCCGLCTIWLDGKPILSCTVLAARANGRAVTTIEGVKVQAEAFAKILAGEGAEQCGYCSPGFIMTVLAMQQELKNPSEEDIVHYLTGNLCRCTGYMGQVRAVKKYLEVTAQ